MGDRVRVLRILEYVGEREWVENTLNRGSVPSEGVKILPAKDLKNSNMIKSSLVDKFPEILEKE